MRNLLRERELRYRAEEAVGLVLDLDDAFSDKKLELKCASMPTPKLRVFFNRKVRALRSFLEANKDLQDITEDSRYEELIREKAIVEAVLRARERDDLTGSTMGMTG